MRFFKYPDELRWALTGRWPIRMEFAVYPAYWRLAWSRGSSWHSTFFLLDLGLFQFYITTLSPTTRDP
jgi:hypothetical protein